MLEDRADLDAGSSCAQSPGFPFTAPLPPRPCPSPEGPFPPGTPPSGPAPGRTLCSGGTVKKPSLRIHLRRICSGSTSGSAMPLAGRAGARVRGAGAQPTPGYRGNASAAGDACRGRGSAWAVGVSGGLVRHRPSSQPRAPRAPGGPGVSRSPRGACSAPPAPGLASPRVLCGAGGTGPRGQGWASLAKPRI